MGSHDPRVDEYIAKSADFARPILAHIREVVHKACPDVEETLKWGFPHFMHHGILCSMASFKSHCALGFWKGSLLFDGDNGGRSEDAMGQFGRIASVRDLPPKKVLADYVKRAAKLNEEGVKVTGSRKNRPPKPVPEMPDGFARALSKSRRARETFDGFPPSHRREYVEWVAEAKTDATREKRIRTSIEWLEEGKSRNWKYERKR